jgi:GNAT superfamily N-acetyltransferase
VTEQKRITVGRPEKVEDVSEMLALLRRAFAYMDGRIDPPSSLHLMDEKTLAAKAEDEDLIWAVESGRGLVGCMFALDLGDVLYLSKIAVDPDYQGHGICRRMMACAEDMAIRRGIPALGLQTRVELVENHAAFARMGFVEVGETSHPGYDQPTSVTMRKPLERA